MTRFVTSVTRFVTPYIGKGLIRLRKPKELKAETQNTELTMTRRGKIARLPHDVREELNSRLQDGQEAKSLLPWLNSLPPVKSVLAKHFNDQSTKSISPIGN